MENAELNTKMKLYAGDSDQGILKPVQLQDDVGNTFEIIELTQITYNELIQRAVKSEYEMHPFYYDESPMAFLYWCNDYLFEFGSFEWSWEDSETSPSGYKKKLTLSNFFYINMTKYKEVIHEQVFERKVKICVLKTDRPILKKITEYIKQRENKT